ncbi:MAG TPA: alpha/beta fold hydrolase [Longimicrobiaceae bacterium]|nr:alpha/beta fold hydrolase [Longimicrobiaceae bacterium]
MQIETLSLPATDGTPLAATLYEPADTAANGRIVILNSAVGVRRGFYDRFARALADRGFAVLTYDYRGIGDSRPTGPRGAQGTIQEWGGKDFAGVLDWTADAQPVRTIAVIGHSIGGQVVGLAPNNGRIAAMLTVSSQIGWCGHWDRPARYMLRFVWHVFLPGTVRMLGYFPARRLGFGDNLPPGIALEWARWCRNPRYMVDERGEPLRTYFDRFRGSLLAYSFADDPFAPRRSVDALVAQYRNAAAEHRHMVPRALRLPKIAHSGFFRGPGREALWPEAAEWLLAATRPSPAGAAALSPSTADLSRSHS